MEEPTFASLGPMLLARKGGARPAMRPQLGPLNGGQTDSQSDADALEDLGWNDMGEADERPANVVNLTPEPANPTTDAEAAEQARRAKNELAEAAFEPPVVHRQQSDIAERMDATPSSSLFSSSPAIARPAKMQALPPITDEDEENEAEGFESEARTAPAPQEPEWSHYRIEPAQVPVETPAITTEQLDAHEPKPRGPTPRTAARDQGKRAAFTLRLDQDRHLKLRLAATMHNLSAQQLVTQALDRLLDDMPELESLAAQMARR